MNLKAVLKNLLVKFHEEQIDFALARGLALSTMGIFRFTKDIDFVVPEEAKEDIHMRGRAFWAARMKSQEGGLDEYIEFLCENMECVPLEPCMRVTDNFKL